MDHAIGSVAMPMPQPNKDEQGKKFISRCVSDMRKKDPSRPLEQIVAMCASSYKKSKAQEVRAAFEAMANCGMDHAKMKSGDKCPECGYVCP